MDIKERLEKYNNFKPNGKNQWVLSTPKFKVEYFKDAPRHERMKLELYSPIVFGVGDWEFRGLMGILEQVREEFRIAKIDDKLIPYYSCLPHYDKTKSEKQKRFIDAETEAEAVEKGAQRLWDCEYIGFGHKYSEDGNVLSYESEPQMFYFFKKKK